MGLDGSSDKVGRDRALDQLPYGLYVVGSIGEQGVSTILVNWVTQVSFNPPLVAVAIESDSKMKKSISGSGYFSLNVLPSGAADTARAFARDPRTTTGTGGGNLFTLSSHGVPFLNDALSCLECRVVDSLGTGDHVTFIGEVTQAMTHRVGEALTLKETGWRYRR